MEIYNVIIGVPIGITLALIIILFLFIKKDSGNSHIIWFILGGFIYTWATYILCAMVGGS